MLPVHVHADDATAKVKYGEPNGKTEAWHILWAVVLTNLGDSVLLETKGVTESVAHAETVLLPAACARVELAPDRDLLLTCLPRTAFHFARVIPIECEADPCQFCMLGYNGPTLS
jgi:hypothetical protein